MFSVINALFRNSGAKIFTAYNFMVHYVLRSFWIMKKSHMIFMKLRFSNKRICLSNKSKEFAFTRLANRLMMKSAIKCERRCVFALSHQQHSGKRNFGPRVQITCELQSLSLDFQALSNFYLSI